jgi:hypothetical protein
MEIDQTLRDLPCLTCREPRADDVRHWLGLVDEAAYKAQLTPGGLPRNCCRVRSLGVVPQSEVAVKVAPPPRWPR